MDGGTRGSAAGTAKPTCPAHSQWWRSLSVRGVRVALAVVTLLVGPLSGPGRAEDTVRVQLAAVQVSPLQSVRLQVTALAVPPSPCVVSLGFLDANGRLITGGSSPRLVTLTRLGETGTVEVSAPVSVTSTLSGTVRLTPILEHPPSPCLETRLRAVAEVVGLGGLVTVHTVVDVGSLVGLNPQPEPPS